MFNNLFQSSAPAPAPRAEPVAPAPAPAPQANPQAAPQPNGQPSPAPAPAPRHDVTQGGALSFADLIGGTSEDVTNMSDSDFAAQMLEQMQQHNPNSDQGMPSFDVSKLQSALQGDGTNPGSLNFMDGIDVNAFVEGLNGDDPAGSVTKFAQSLQNNVVMGMAPMINELVSAAVQHAQKASVSESHQSLTSSAIVSDFGQRYAYASNPAIKGMLPSMANRLAQSAPAGTPPRVIAEKLHRIFQGMGVGQGTGQHDQQTNLGSDMSNLFTS